MPVPKLVLAAPFISLLGAPAARALGLERWDGRGGRRRVVVVQGPHGGRREVVELAVAGRPRIGADGAREEHQRDRQHHEDDAHVVGSKVRLRQEASTTVSELAGIRMAAISGLICPPIASAAPAML